jgi:outer membrane immunogenic protein
MKKLIFTFATIFASLLTYSQNPVAVGQMQLNAGGGFSNNGIPIYVGLDYGIHKDVTVGGEASFRLDDNGNNGLGILANGNYHFNSLLKMPTKYGFYAGANVGFHMDLGDGDSSGLSLGLQVGGRYYFNEKFGLNLEFGGGNYTSGGKIGISLKF